MPAGTPPQDRSGGALQYIDLADFTAGLTSGPLGFGRGAGGGTDTGVETQHGNGAADPRYTWGCYGHPNGGLHPAPRLDRMNEHIPDPGTDPATDVDAADFPGATKRFQVLSSLLVSPVSDNGDYDTALDDSGFPDELFYVIEYFKQVELAELDPGLGVVSVNSGEYLAWQTFYVHKMHRGTVWPGIEAVQLEWKYDDETYLRDTTQLQHIDAYLTLAYYGIYETDGVYSGALPHVAWNPGRRGDLLNFSDYIYPEWDDSPADPQRLQDATTRATAGRAFHQGRAVIPYFERINVGPYGGYKEERQTPFGDRAATPLMALFYTTPPLAVTVSTPVLFLLDGDTSGVGVIQSLSAADLFIASHGGGGFLVSGDLANPTIRRLPYLPAIGGAQNIGAATDKGFVFGSKSGVWVYRGADTAECISSQLEGQFWYVGERTFPENSMVPNHHQGRFAYSYPFLYAPNNFICDMRTGGWFRLFPNVDLMAEAANYELMGLTALDVADTDDARGYTVDALECHTSVNGNAYLVAGYFTGAYSSQALWLRFRADQGSPWYRWRSHPLAQSRNRFLNYREINLVVEGVGTVEVDLIGLDGAKFTQSVTFDTTGDETPHLYALPVNLTTWDVVVEIRATAPNSVLNRTDYPPYDDTPGTAPTIHRVSLGYQETRSAISTGRDSTA